MRRIIRTSAVTILVTGVTLGTALAEPVRMAERLLAVRHQRECRITTTGRKSGNPHTVPVWFAVDGDTLLLSTLDATRDWVKNALATPTVTMAFDELTVRGRFRDVTGTPEEASVVEALRAKYWVAKAAGWLGKGPERTFVVDQLEVVD